MSAPSSGARVVPEGNTDAVASGQDRPRWTHGSITPPLLKSAAHETHPRAGRNPRRCDRDGAGLSLLRPTPGVPAGIRSGVPASGVPPHVERRRSLLRAFRISDWRDPAGLARPPRLLPQLLHAAFLPHRTDL